LITRDVANIERGPQAQTVLGRVLVVEDDFRISVFVQRALVQAGYEVQAVENGESALTAAEQTPPDLIVLDVMLPGLDGLEVARRLRATRATPILMLTARDAVGDRVQGLDAGADDYLVKPFAVEELLARLRALLRRREVDAAERRRGVLAFADLQLDQDTRHAERVGRPLELRRMEFELLAYLMRHPGRVLSRRELFEEVWGYNFLGDTNVIEVTVGHLRQKLEAEGRTRLIHTVRSAGYVLREQGPAQ
jgi:two-component system, OmpR family, response regulator MprA